MKDLVKYEGMAPHNPFAGTERGGKLGEWVKHIIKEEELITMDLLRCGGRFRIVPDNHPTDPGYVIEMLIDNRWQIMHFTRTIRLGYTPGGIKNTSFFSLLVNITDGMVTSCEIKDGQCAL